MAVIQTSSGATVTSTFQSKIFIGAGCLVSAATLDFGTNGILAANVDATSLVTVSCTAGTAFQLGLDQGTGAGASTSIRYMTGPASAKISYLMFSDNGRTSNWGNSPGVDTVSGLGIGISQSLTVYGRVPTQTTPAPGSYTDTVTATVTY